MGPPLSFFMTRLLFVEKAKVNSLKATTGQKSSVEIVVDNPRILPESRAKSLPPIPFPPAAPDSPVPVEGWKGIKVGGWIGGFGGSNGKLNPPAVYHGDGDAAAADAFDDLKVAAGEDDDNTEVTEESNSAAFDMAPSVGPAVVEVEPPALVKAAPAVPKLFPANSARGLGSKGSSIGRKLGKSLQRPSMKKKGSKSGSSASSLLGGKNSHSDSSSPHSSGAED